MRKLFLACIGFFIPTIAYAQKHLTDYGFDCKGVGMDLPGCGSAIDLTTAASQKIFNFGYAIAGPLASIIFLYGALRMVISRGDEGKEAGKKAMIYGALGLVFVLLSWSIVKLVETYIWKLIP